jgi:integrase
METPEKQPEKPKRKQIRKRTGGRRRRPKYCKHSTGKGMVWRDQKAIYFPGLHNSPESLEAYRNYLLKLQGETPAPPPPSEMFMLIFLDRFREDQFPKLPKSEQGHFRVMMRIVGEIFGGDLAADFGPLKLKRAREIFCEQKVKNADRLWSRTQVNKQTRRLVRIFKWGVSEELIEPSQWQAMEAIEPLKKGETDAPESSPVRAIPWETAQKTMEHASPTVAAMIRLHWLTGMRSSNLCELRARDIDMSKDVWEYIPSEHKNAWKDQQLFIAIGPEAQALLFQFVWSRPPDEYLFSPRDSAIWQSQKRWQERKSPRWLSAAAKRGRINPRLRNKYDAHSYKNAVGHACKKAKIDEWHPHQLRHSRGTEIKKRFGAEASRVSLGHSTLSATEIYAERDHDLARKVAREMG